MDKVNEKVTIFIADQFSDFLVISMIADKIAPILTPKTQTNTIASLKNTKMPTHKWLLSHSLTHHNSS